MAGSWPDAPGTRLAYQTGSAELWWKGAGVKQQAAPGVLLGLNSYAADPGGRLVFDSLTPIVWLLFDVPHDLKGWLLAGRSSGGVPTVQVATSVDTTTGEDGSWMVRQSGVAAQASGSASMASVYRTPQPVSADQVTGVRFTLGYTGTGAVLSAVHCYADVRAGAVSQRLQMWDPDSDQPAGAALLDWGDAVRGSAQDRVFRVRNCSTTLTARRVAVASRIVPGDEASSGPPVASQFLLSTDGLRYAPHVSLGDLAPDSISAPVRVRRVTPSTAQTGTFDPYLTATPAAWSAD
jgi:hypothetical protein